MQLHQQQTQCAPAAGSERRNSNLARRLQDESNVHYSSSEGSSSNSPMMRIVGDRRQPFRAANPHHYVNSHHHQESISRISVSAENFLYFLSLKLWKCSLQNNICIPMFICLLWTTILDLMHFKATKKSQLQT
jgi:hypothetical protein